MGLVRALVTPSTLGVLGLLGLLVCGACGSDDADTGAGATPAPGDNSADAGGAPDASQTTDGSSGTDSSTPSKPTILYAMTGGDDGQIHVFRVDQTNGGWQSTDDFEAGDNPSFLAADLAHGRVYAVDEANDGQVLAFSFDRTAGKLAPLGSPVSTGGAGPTHLSIDPSGKFVLVAMYGAGRVSTFPIQADGSLGAAADTKDSGEKAHLAIVNPSGGFAFVPCLGANYVAQYTFDSAGKLTANAGGNASPPDGAGPRHLDFHPSEKFAYGTNELASTMTSYAFDKATGRLSPIETQSMLPADYTDDNTAAEVYVHPSGKFVYGSNRGHDSIAVFTVDASTGKLTLSSHAKTNGETPRSFASTRPDAFSLPATKGRTRFSPSSLTRPPARSRPSASRVTSTSRRSSGSSRSTSPEK